MPDNKSEPTENPLDDESGEDSVTGAGRPASDGPAEAGAQTPGAQKPGAQKPGAAQAGAQKPGAAGAGDSTGDSGGDSGAGDEQPFALDEEQPIDPLAVLREELAVVREELAGARAEAAQYKDQLLRALAEGENQRRRAAREREDAVKFAGAALAKDLLAVADNFDRALANIPEDAFANDPALKALHEGIAATQRELAAAFERHRIRKIDPKGEKFDSHRHQAMFELETADVPPGHVAQVLQPGYVMHDERLLRAAMVVVAKAPPPPAPANDSDANNRGSGR
ncbi:MAG: nucleotide exchange factor GrpE [Dongiaceae bacterium]